LFVGCISLVRPIKKSAVYAGTEYICDSDSDHPLSRIQKRMKHIARTATIWIVIFTSQLSDLMCPPIIGNRTLFPLNGIHSGTPLGVSESNMRCVVTESDARIA